MNFSFSPENFLKTLPYLGKGMLGVLIVVSLIIAVTVGLNKIFR